jgi:LPS export ABC transporter protein LptC/lipopolysaccharide transport protein LptA
MTKKRIILFSILFCFFLLFILSVAGVLPNRLLKETKEVPLQVVEGKSYAELQEEGEGRVTQYVGDFCFPSYDASGKETFVLRGKEAVLIDDKVYKIKKPEVRIKGSAINTGTQEAQDIVINSRLGEMDKQSNIGNLYRKVVIKLDENTTVKTDSLKYVPGEKKAYTEDKVTVRGDRMLVRGEGMIAEMDSGRVWIERNVVAELEGAESNIFMVSLGQDNKKETKPRKTYIRCNGKLVFEKEPNMATFHKAVRARRGTSTLASDKLVLVFGKGGNKPKLIIAEGNVLASDGSKLAKGKSLFWDAVTDATTLEDEPTAEFFEEKTSIIAPKMIFYQTEDRVDAPRGGQLTTRGLKADDSQRGAFGGWGNVTIIWKGKMNFQKAQQKAFFEEDVQLSRKDFKMNSQNLEVGFQGEDLKAKDLKATGNVYILEKSENLLREAYGQEATWDLVTNFIEIPGQGTLFMQGGEEEPKEEGKVNVSWDKKMTMDDTQKKITFYEKVRAIKGMQKVNCNQLNVFMGEGNKVNHVVALGDVLFTDTKEGGIEGIGDTMEWDWEKDTMILSGTPTAEVRRKKNRTFAKKIYYDTNSQRISWRERPHWQIPLEGKDSSRSFSLTP